MRRQETLIMTTPTPYTLPTGDVPHAEVREIAALESAPHVTVIDDTPDYRVYAVGDDVAAVIYSEGDLGVYWRDCDPTAYVAALAQVGHPNYSATTWNLYEGDMGSAYATITADSAEEALVAARSNVDRSNYDDADGTLWIDVRVVNQITGEEATDTVTLDPDVPTCADGHDHDWQSPYSVVGGIENNPGVWGHGGGVIIREVCAHCGTYRVTDTWAQRMDTGEQGLTSVAYESADDQSLAWIESDPCDHPQMTGDTCDECGESCSHRDVGATDDGICHDPDCPIHGDTR